MFGTPGRRFAVRRSGRAEIPEAVLLLLDRGEVRRPLIAATAAPSAERPALAAAITAAAEDPAVRREERCWTTRGFAH